jgi:hypothetical protein
MDESMEVSKGNREAAWAAPVHHLEVKDLPKGAVNLNVAGRHLTGPLHGFGQLWQKTYRIKLKGSPTGPEEIIQTWKENFQRFWPEGNHFFSQGGGIVPGEVAVLNLAGPGGVTGPGGRPLISTGIMVIYADEESFSFMTPEGHMFAGMITFSASLADGGSIVQVQALVRANDPIYEMSFRLGFGHRSEDKFWEQTLMNLAAYFGVDGTVEKVAVCVDPKVQWAEARNIWHNAAMRTGIYLMLTPVRWVRGSLTKKNA